MPEWSLGTSTCEAEQVDEWLDDPRAWPRQPREGFQHLLGFLLRRHRVRGPRSLALEHGVDPLT